ncbi:class I SAM-dependent DNA methyltransferase [Aureimonas psammosilenae]|uniref:class I SAM-dependent DNA methyltransferase n=1 Tax=Aureimonas psammosilenae TaxID=2495496 RepID=UPI001260B88D|nr:methyltransferase domain-containing protein [Aureimonas psammosilenae]
MQTGNIPLDPQAARRADYAKGYAEDGDFAAAADLMRQALELAPEWAAGWAALGNYLDKAGEREAAGEALSRAASLDENDSLGARAKLAAMGLGDLPGTLPAPFVRGLFDQYADRFERQLRDKLHYRAPELLLDALPASRFAAALDLGCGTGLMGELLRPRAERLVGLDLSPKMLAKARAKNVYDELHEADILGFDAPTGSFDLVSAADVLNYVGDLAPVFVKAHIWLATNGLLAFTVEAHTGPEPYALRETMRYAHSGDAVAMLLEEAGFDLLHRGKVDLREDRGEPVEGWIFVATR